MRIDQSIRDVTGAAQRDRLVRVELRGKWRCASIEAPSSITETTAIAAAIVLGMLLRSLSSPDN